MGICSRPVENRRHACPDKRGRLSSTESERGFTLAGLIVILTIIAVFLAYTVPTQWSKILQRDRERQTIFVMRQYARAIHESQKSSCHKRVEPAKHRNAVPQWKQSPKCKQSSKWKQCPKWKQSSSW